jgi:ribosomal protein S16
MKKKLLVVLIAALTLLVSQTYADMEKQIKEARQEKQKTLLELFDGKCTKCHDAPDAKKLHKMYNKPIDAVRTMQGKKGAEISDLESIDIAEFLDGPQLALMQKECTKCHNLDRIVRACSTGTLNKDTIKRMQQKGARINDEQVDMLFEMLNKKAQFEKRITLLDLFGSKCTKCHDASRAQKIHQTGRKPKDAVIGMQQRDVLYKNTPTPKEKYYGITDQEAIDIAKFLENPYWLQPLFKDKCTKCHTLDRIIDTCNKGPTSINVSKETIKKMQKKGAKITDEQVDMMYEILNN